MSANSDNEGSYAVVVNDNAEYSLWPADRPFPSGWRPTNHIGSKQSCLDHIELVWVDARMLGLRGREALRGEGDRETTEPATQPNPEDGTLQQGCGADCDNKTR